MMTWAAVVMASRRLFTKDMYNVLTAVEMNEAVLSHAFAEPLDELLASHPLAGDEQEQQQHVVERWGVLEHRLSESQTRQLEGQARRGGCGSGQGWRRRDLGRHRG